MIFNLIPIVYCQAICTALYMSLKMLHMKKYYSILTLMYVKTKA